MKSDPSPASRPPPLGLNWPKAGAVPLVFVEVDSGEERRAPDGVSIYNAQEARAAVAVVEALLAAAPRSHGLRPAPAAAAGGMLSVAGPGEIGVIAPYAAQVRVLQELWAESQRRNNRGGSEEPPAPGTGKKYASEEEATAAAAAAAAARAAQELEVHSVDGFQAGAYTRPLFGSM